MEDLKVKHNAIVNILKEYGRMKGWWNSIDSQVSYIEDKDTLNYHIVFSRFAVKNYLLELNNSSKTELDKKIIELFKAELPFLNKVSIYFCDTEKLSSEIWKLDKVQNSVLKYII